MTYQHDEAGRLVAVRDARGFIERYEYDDNLLVTYENRTGGRTHYAYDGERRCAATWQANGKLFRRFEFDVLRRNTLVLDGRGRQTLHRFDKDAVVDYRTDRRNGRVELSRRIRMQAAIACMTDPPRNAFRSGASRSGSTGTRRGRT